MTKKQIRENLRALFKTRLKMSDAKIGAMAGVSRQAVTNWWNKTRPSCPGGLTLRTLSQNSGYSMEFMQTGQGPELTGERAQVRDLGVELMDRVVSNLRPAAPERRYVHQRDCLPPADEILARAIALLSDEAEGKWHKWVATRRQAALAWVGRVRESGLADQPDHLAVLKTFENQVRFSDAVEVAEGLSVAAPWLFRSLELPEPDRDPNPRFRGSCGWWPDVVAEVQFPPTTFTGSGTGTVRW